MKVCVVKSGETLYLCNAESEYKEGDRVWWECSEENGWGTVVVSTFPLNPDHYNHCACEGKPIGRILGTFIPTKAYKDAVKKESKNKFKVWCETREERDEVLVALSMDGIGIKNPLDTYFLKAVPVGVHVFGDQAMLCSDREVFDENDAPQKRLYRECFFVNAEK